MTVSVRLPQWSMNMREGKILAWLKCEGESVAKGDDLVEVETAKVVQVVEAPVSGTVREILVAEGEIIPVRAVLCTIEPAVGEVDLALEDVKRKGTSAGSGLQRPGPQDRQGMRVTPVAERLASAEGIDLSQIEGSGSAGRITKEDVRRASEKRVATERSASRPRVEPRARRLAREHGLDLQYIGGSGPGGRITEADVIEAVEQARARGEGDLVPYEGTRRLIGERMMTSLRETAQVTLSLEVDVADLERAKEALNSRLHLTYTDLVVKAVALALAEHPRMNARMDPEGIRLVAEINVGVAVALDEGLVVPVIRDADRKRLSEISGERTRLVHKAREGLLNQSEVTGGTFTVSNLGMYGIRVFTPIINPPEAAILGVGSIVERPTNREGDLIWRKMMALSLTFDHRLVDGALAATFLRTLKGKLESPDWLPEGALEPER